MKHFLNLFVSFVILLSPVACRLKTKSFLFCCKCHFPADRSQRSADLSQCAEGMDLTNRNWSTEETCELIFFCLLNVVPTQKRFLFFSFDIFDAQSIKPAATMRNVLIFFFMFLETPHGVFVFTAAVC